MGKKKKDRGEEDDEGRPSPSSDVFKALFGDVSEKTDLSSIFSGANPFKRKIEELAVRGGVPDGRDGAGGGFKRRRRMEEEEVEEFLVDSVAGKDDGMVEGDGGVDGSSGGEGGREERGEEGRSMRKNKRKRKREELERLYEVKKYGEEAKEAGRVSDGKISGKKRKKADDSADALVVKEEGFDDEGKLLRTVFVGNLPLKVKKKALVKEFGKFGEVESVRIRSVPLLDTKTPRKGAIRQKEVNDAVDR